jgi:hypothetical protein
MGAMRTRVVICLILLSLPGLVAAETPVKPPGESFVAFISGITDTELTPAARTELIEHYFDFEAWMRARAADEDRQYTAEERAEFQQQWLELLSSRRFRETYRDRDLRVERVTEDADRATVRISLAMSGQEQREHFDVLMTPAETHWRWHLIRPVAAPVPEPRPEPQADTRAARIEHILAAIEQLRELEAGIANRLLELEAELSKLRAEQAEERAGEGSYSTPMTTAATLGRALLAEDAAAVARAHVPTRRPSDTEALESRVGALANSLARWEPVDVKLLDDGNRAIVRVRVTLWPERDGAVETRTQMLALRLIGEEWLVDENP